MVRLSVNASVIRKHKPNPRGSGLNLLGIVGSNMWWVPIAVALIGGPLMWGLHRFDKRNSEQHGENLKVLRSIERKVDKVDDRLHGHIEWHIDQKGKP